MFGNEIDGCSWKLKLESWKEKARPISGLKKLVVTSTNEKVGCLEPICFYWNQIYLVTLFLCIFKHHGGNRQHSSTLSLHIHYTLLFHFTIVSCFFTFNLLTLKKHWKVKTVFLLWRNPSIGYIIYRTTQGPNIVATCRSMTS